MRVFRIYFRKRSSKTNTNEELQYADTREKLSVDNLNPNLPFTQREQQAPPQTQSHVLIQHRNESNFIEPKTVNFFIGLCDIEKFVRL